MSELPTTRIIRLRSPKPDNSSVQNIDTKPSKEWATHQKRATEADLQFCRRSGQRNQSVVPGPQLHK